MNESATNQQRNNRFLSQRAACFSPRGHVRSLTHQLVNFPAQRTVKTTTRTALALLLPLLTISLAAGCAKPPATTPEDVVDYVRNAVVGAEARRLDSEHQRHVTSVLASYRAWEKRCAPMQKLCETESLWPMDSAKWRDAAAVAKLQFVLAAWVDSIAAIPETDAETITQEVEDVPAAIRGMPYSSDVQAQITDLLDLEREETKLKDAAALYAALLSFVGEHRASFDASGAGLAFSDAESTKVARGHWQQIDEVIRKYSEAHRAEVLQTLAEYPGKRDAAIDEKRTLYSMANPTQNEIRARRRLDVLVRYYDTTIKSAEREKNKLEAPVDDPAK